VSILARESDHPLGDLVTLFLYPLLAGHHAPRSRNRHPLVKLDGVAGTVPQLRPNRGKGEGRVTAGHSTERLREKEGADGMGEKKGIITGGDQR
jgi:hypothetical protein